MKTIFISSTFQDMHQERDVLQYEVLPKLKELAKQYGKNIELCDLRWGVDSLHMDEEESTAKVLQVCFDEIYNAKPFFIVLLGERYGWVPNSQIVESAIKTSGFPLKNLKDIADKSVTELEIIYGALSDEAVDTDVYFYFRNISNGRQSLFGKSALPEAYLSHTADDKNRMTVLKNKIRDKYPQKIRNYSVKWNKNDGKFEKMDEFAEMVFKDISAMLIRQWGEPQKLTEIEKQLNQYQYAMEIDNYFDSSKEMKLQLADIYKEILIKGNWMENKQSCYLIAREQYNLNRLMATLFFAYKELGYDVIPYDCGQSVLASSTLNLIRYFTEILSRRIDYPIVDYKFDDKEEQISIFEKYVKQFHEVLEKVDSILSSKILFLIRDLEKLEEKDIFKWFPCSKYKHIRFILSSNEDLSGPTVYKETTATIYFQNSAVFERSSFIDAYMLHYRKEADKFTKSALLEKVENKNEQYLEMLMQNILLLTQKDFDIIHKSGDGIQKISDYLVRRIKNMPDNLEEIICNQVKILEEDIGEVFTHTVLGVLLSLPYGIPLHHLQQLMAENGVAYSTLSMSLFTKRMASIVNETLDGYVKINDSPASKCLRNVMKSDYVKWTIQLEKYMTSQLLQCKEVTDEFYQNQYLHIACNSGKKDAVSIYLDAVNHDSYCCSLGLLKIFLQQNTNDWFYQNVRNLKEKNVEWMLHDFYPYILNKKCVKQGILKIWEELRRKIDNIVDKNRNHENLYLWFMVNYQAGELAHLLKCEEYAEKYLLLAKEISLEDFRKYPNRIWKLEHGMELTKEEKLRGTEGITDMFDEEDDIPLMGFDSEIEDCVMEQSWTIKVRIINSYLIEIYRERGEHQKADILEKEKKKITHMFDPDPQNTGKAEIAPGIKIIYPEQFEDMNIVSVKHRYKPDYRRNTAIDIAKEAILLKKQKKKEEAYKKFEESNQILQEIYEDGETGEYYDLNGCVEEPDKIRVMLRTECQRDIALNCQAMIGCLDSKNEVEQIKKLVSLMIENGEAYDTLHNNMQSKSTLQECYQIALTAYYLFENPKEYEQILTFCDYYYRYRIEAHQKGEETDDYIMQQRKNANYILSRCVMSRPELGERVVDIILKNSNDSVKKDDFNGYSDFTYFSGDLLDWMWEHSMNWENSLCSLESIYAHNSENLGMLWEQHCIWGRLENDAKNLYNRLKYFNETENVLLAAKTVLRYVKYLFNEGKYKEAAVYEPTVMSIVTKLKNDCDIYKLVDFYSIFIAILSEAGELKKGAQLADKYEEILQQIVNNEYSIKEVGMEMSRNQIENWVIKERIILNVNYAVICSRMGDEQAAQRRLQLAEMIALQN